MLRRNRRKGKEYFLFKPVSMAAQAWIRRILLFFFKQTSGWTTPKQQLLQHKPLLVKRLRVHRRSGSSKGRQHGVTSKPSSLILEADESIYSFSDILPCVWIALVFLFSCVFIFFFLSAKFPQAGTRARRFFDQGWERLGCVKKMDEARHGHHDLHQQRS